MEVLGSQYENSLTEAFNKLHNFIEEVFNVLSRQKATSEDREPSRNMW